MKNMRTRDFTHLVNQCKTVLRSLSMPRRYLWYHRHQGDCLYRSEHRVRQTRKYKSKHNSLFKKIAVNTVFTFNISARRFAPASPIELANRTANGVKREKIENKNQTAGKHGDSLTDEINRIQCCVHFQRFGNLRSAICSNMVPCLFSRKKSKHLKRGQKTIHSP